jgi:hypothetical protein
VNFKRWQTRAQLWLLTMGVFWVMSNPPTLPLGSEKEVQEFTVATTVFVRCVLSILSNQLCDVHISIKSVDELWEALEHKFSASDIGRKLYVMEQYHDFNVFGCNDRMGRDETIPQIRLFGSGSRVGTGLF